MSPVRRAVANQPLLLRCCRHVLGHDAGGLLHQGHGPLPAIRVRGREEEGEGGALLCGSGPCWVDACTSPTMLLTVLILVLVLVVGSVDG